MRLSAYLAKGYRAFYASKGVVSSAGPKTEEEMIGIALWWQAKLHLADWDLDISFDEEIYPPALGVCWPDHVYKRLCIAIAPPEIVGEDYDLEHAVVHELVHAHYAAQETVAGTYGRIEEERSVEALTRTLISLRRAGPSGTDRVVAMLRRDDMKNRKKTMIDPKVLASLCVEGGAFVGRDDIPDDVKDYIKRLTEALAGGAPSADDASAESDAAADSDTSNPAAELTEPSAEETDKTKQFKPPLEIRVDKIERDAVISKLGSRLPPSVIKAASGLLDARGMQKLLEAAPAKIQPGQSGSPTRGKGQGSPRAEEDDVEEEVNEALGLAPYGARHNKERRTFSLMTPAEARANKGKSKVEEE